MGSTEHDRDAIKVTEEVRIPLVLLEASCIDGSDSIINAIDGELMGPESNDGSQMLMSVEKSLILTEPMTNEVDPEGRIGGCRMCRRDTAKRRKQQRPDNVIVEEVEKE